MTADPDDPHVGLIVEGRGEVDSIPLLLRKALYANDEYRDLLGKVIPCNGRDRATRPGGIEAYVTAAAARPGCRAVLIVLDSEGDPACELGPSLRRRAQDVIRVPVTVCLAEPKYESWLLASAETMGLSGLDPTALGDPTAQIRSALDGKYVKPRWQPRLTDRMDLDVAMPRSASLLRLVDKLYAAVAQSFP